jgi:hypothetical protein
MHEGWEAAPTGSIAWTINARQGGRIGGFRWREAENPATCSLLHVDAEEHHVGPRYRLNRDRTVLLSMPHARASVVVHVRIRPLVFCSMLYLNTVVRQLARTKL